MCEPQDDEMVSENELCYAIRNQACVAEGHILAAPKRHVYDYFKLYQPELNAIQRMVLERKEQLAEQDKSITAFNVVIESGEDAGQSIPHCHIHLVPRRKGENVSLGFGVQS